MTESRGGRDPDIATHYLRESPCGAALSDPRTPVLNEYHVRTIAP